MQPLLFIFYLLVVSFIITKIPFFKHSGIEKRVLIALFVIKIIAGIAYAKFYTVPKYYANSDTWRFYRLSLGETDVLLQSPLSFFADLFHYGYNTSGNIFSGENTYWNDLKSNLMVKIMAVFNVFTGNSYYCNIILFNFLFLFGLVALFKVFITIFPAKKWIIIGSIFLLPSTLFWCSGIHKDGLILSATGTVFYCFFRPGTRKFAFKYLVVVAFAFVLIFSLRNYILFALIPALACRYLAEKYPAHKNAIFATAYLAGATALFVVPIILPAINLPVFIAVKQQEFLQLKAGSQVYTHPLIPTAKGFIAFLPHALDMVFLRPHINETANVSYLPAVLENIILIASILVSMVSFNRHKPQPPVVLALFAFSLTVLLICGYTVPFTGAIVRYRSLVLPILLTPLLCSADFSFIRKRL